MKKFRTTSLPFSCVHLHHQRLPVALCSSSSQRYLTLLFRSVPLYSSIFQASCAVRFLSNYICLPLAINCADVWLLSCQSPSETRPNSFFQFHLRHRQSSRSRVRSEVYHRQHSLAFFVLWKQKGCSRSTIFQSEHNLLHDSHYKDQRAYLVHGASFTIPSFSPAHIAQLDLYNIGQYPFWGILIHYSTSRGFASPIVVWIVRRCIM